MNIPRQLKACYLSHGGGPLPLLGDPGHKEMVAGLKTISGEIKKPKAIVVVSAHWEEDIVSITSGETPSIIYDYYGFPDEAYKIRYAAPGAPDLARKIFEVFDQNSVPVRLDQQRGFDHGLYVPLKIMYPLADIPCIEVSLLRNLDPAEHLRIGEMLALACGEQALVIGSGSSFHNMSAFKTKTSGTDEENQEFERWLIQTCTDTSVEESERVERFISWDKAPAARYCHPREEHLLPLHVCYGMFGKPCEAHRTISILGKQMSFFFW